MRWPLPSRSHPQASECARVRVCVASPETIFCPSALGTYGNSCCEGGVVSKRDLLGETSAFSLLVFHLRGNN